MYKETHVAHYDSSLSLYLVDSLSPVVIVVVAVIRFESIPMRSISISGRSVSAIDVSVSLFAESLPFALFACPWTIL